MSVKQATASFLVSTPWAGHIIRAAHFICDEQFSMISNAEGLSGMNWMEDNVQPASS